MFCSTVIATIGRATLANAVGSVLEQGLDEDAFEIIVVNDSGQALPHAEWQRSSHVRVIETNRRERSVARNTGAAIARGQYLHFLDDDDLLLRGALPAFREFHQREPNVDWIYGNWQIADNNGKILDEFKPAVGGNIFSLLVAGEGLPLQGSLLRASLFFAVGAFDPTFSATEDRDLGRRIALVGSVGHVNTAVARIRVGEETSTTRWADLAERDRWGREKALNASNAFARLRASAGSSYWRGRVTRAYVASTVWNLRRCNFATAAGRAFSALALAAWHPLLPSFWKGLRTKIN